MTRHIYAQVAYETVDEVQEAGYGQIRQKLLIGVLAFYK